ncbi:RDD family protein [Halobacillus sp. K22]|uniref:RDD family protein n=1 Tax=Halobacillus sp. K22 TaxID=3457431 RepID=UPI003FCEE01B
MTVNQTDRKVKVMDQSVGFLRRFGAVLLDSLIVFLPIGLLVSALFQTDLNSLLSNMLEGLYLLIVPVFWYGYVVGKRLMGIRIVKTNGKDVGIGTMLLRVVLSGFIYGLTFGVLYIVSAFFVGFRKDHRAIHDLIAGTYVTDAEPGEAAALPDA